MIQMIDSNGIKGIITLLVNADCIYLFIYIILFSFLFPNLYWHLFVFSSTLFSVLVFILSHHVLLTFSLLFFPHLLSHESQHCAAE